MMGTTQTINMLIRDALALQAQPQDARWVYDQVYWLALELKKAGVDKYERLWRVTLKPGAPIQAVSIDMPISDEDGTEHSFADWDALPEWMQDRIRALGMITGKPPTDWIDGIGRRMSDDVYWVLE